MVTQLYIGTTSLRGSPQLVFRQIAWARCKTLKVYRSRYSKLNFSRQLSRGARPEMRLHNVLAKYPRKHFGQQKFRSRAQGARSRFFRIVLDRSGVVLLLGGEQRPQDPGGDLLIKCPRPALCE